ncbi:18152_t:CDS:2, partial [Rhizophagus irregularis]
MSLEENIEENIQLINKYDIFESRFGIVIKKLKSLVLYVIIVIIRKPIVMSEITSDYDLNLEERKAKYRNSNYILCEECNNEIFKGDFYCTYCYNEETDIIKKGHMKFGSSFKILDCNLNLEERRAEYMNYDGILCEKCNNEIDKWYYCCAYCYYKETDIIKKGHIKFGPKFGIFKTSDYNLDLKERRKKYMNYDNILCEECNYYNEETDFIKKAYMKYEYEYVKYSNEIDKWDCYCTYCYDKETDVIKKRHMKFGPKFEFGIFKTSDYNLDLKERITEYMNYDSILCEKCNNKIEDWNYYCAYCYCKETDVIKKGHMKFGPKFKFGIFKTSDYNLDLKERRAEYMNYHSILCEKCNNKIEDWYYYCTCCYDKETDVIKKGHMKFGPKFKFGIFKTSDYNLDLKERRAEYMNYHSILCEKCNNGIDNFGYYYCAYCYDKETDVIKKNHMKFGPDFKFFNTFDYNLNLEERKAKYEKYDIVVCEKCNQGINKHNYYCTRCYNKETDVIKKGHMKFGSDFKIFNTFDNNLNLEERKAKYEKYDIVQFLENFSKWINENNVFIESKIEISDYDLDEDDRRVKYKNFDYILCEKCDRKYHYNYCYECFDKEIRELKDCENFYFKVYNKETKELRELKELQSILIDYKNVYFKLNSNLGIFKQIIQQFDNTKNYVDNKKILINNIRYNGVHNCWRKLRSYCCDCYDREIDIIEKK